MALTKSGEFTFGSGDGAEDDTDSSTDQNDEFPGTTEQEDLATASGASMVDGIADWMSDRRGEARADTTADVDPETDPGRSSIGAAAGLYGGAPSDTPTEIDIDTNESGEITDVDTSNTVESADDDPDPTKDTTPDRGVETDKKTATGSGGGADTSGSDGGGGGGGGGGSSTSETSGGGGSKKKQRAAPKVVKVPFPVPKAVKTQDQKGQTGVPMQLVLIGLLGVGALVYLSADGGAGDGGGGS